MKGSPIYKAEPMPDGLLRVTFDTGNSVIVSMKPKLSSMRFSALQKPEIWWTADTDGVFVHWYRDGMAVVELSYDELLRMTLGEAY